MTRRARSSTENAGRPQLGTHVDELIDVRKHPERHRYLVFRIAGHSGRFVPFEPEWQDELIARTLYAPA